MDNKEEFKNMKAISDNIIELYREKVDEKEWHNWCSPHSANFSENDYVINLMGINPNIDINGSKEDKEDKTLDLYYVYEKNEIQKEFNNEKINKYVCNNTSFVNNQYLFWNNADYRVFEKPVKMSWQKYNQKFLETFYHEKGEEYYKLVKQILEYYKSKDIEFEKNKYFIFTDLFYISNSEQKFVIDHLTDEIYENIKDLFYKQMNYYKSKITIVANSDASKIVRNKIINSEKEKWKRVVLYGDEEYEEYSNIYKYKNSYVVLTSRYFSSSMDFFSKRTFAKEMRKLIAGEIIREKELE